jgi:hypothetical protein
MIERTANNWLIGHTMCLSVTYFFTSEGLLETIVSIHSTRGSLLYTDFPCFN